MTLDRENELSAEQALSYLQKYPEQIVISTVSSLQVVLVDDEHISVVTGRNEQILHVREFLESFGSRYFRPLRNNEY